MLGARRIIMHLSTIVDELSIRLSIHRPQVGRTCADSVERCGVSTRTYVILAFPMELLGQTLKVETRVRPPLGLLRGVRTKRRAPLAQKGGPKVAPRVVPRCSGEATSTPDRGTAAPAAELCPQRSGTGLLSLTSPFPGCACQLTLGAARSWRIPPGRSRCAAPRQDPSQRWR